MTPIAVKAYRAGVHKNDQRDARAVAEATGRSQVAAVRVKSEAAQATQAVMRVRERRIRERGQTANELGGLLNEFGSVVPKGPQLLLARACELMATAPFAALPAAVQELVQTLVDEVVEQAEKVKAVDAALMTAVQADANCRLLMSIPSIGPINAAGLAVALEAPRVFRRGRAFAAFLRLVPRQQASAESSNPPGAGRHQPSDTPPDLVLAPQPILTRP